jgi:hypothetical protein
MAKVLKTTAAINTWLSGAKVFTVTPGVKTVGWKLKGGSKWEMDFKGTTLPVIPQNFITCVWTESPAGSGQGKWKCTDCATCTPTLPAPPSDDMPEGLEIIIQC